LAALDPAEVEALLHFWHRRRSAVRREGDDSRRPRLRTKRQRRNPGITEIREIPNRGHSLTIDSGWREVAEVALAFVKQHHPTPSAAAGMDRAVASMPSEGAPP